jgi:hypothetical protein
MPAKKFATLAAASFALLAITIPARAESPPLIVIDRWWGVDYAKVNCHKWVSPSHHLPRQTAR